jgi:hypothetical protein
MHVSKNLCGQKQNAKEKGNSLVMKKITSFRRRPESRRSLATGK